MDCNAERAVATPGNGVLPDRVWRSVRLASSLGLPPQLLPFFPAPSSAARQPNVARAPIPISPGRFPSSESPSRTPPARAVIMVFVCSPFSRALRSLPLASPRCPCTSPLGTRRDIGDHGKAKEDGAAAVGALEYPKHEQSDVVSLQG
jgi:hypothetical protein